MLDTKALMYAIVLAALIGIVAAVLENSFFPSWDNAPLVRGAILGGLCGLVYPIIVSVRRK